MRGEVVTRAGHVSSFCSSFSQHFHLNPGRCFSFPLFSGACFTVPVGDGWLLCWDVWQPCGKHHLFILPDVCWVWVGSGCCTHFSALELLMSFQVSPRSWIQGGPCLESPFVRAGWRINYPALFASKLRLSAVILLHNPLSRFCMQPNTFGYP